LFQRHRVQVWLKRDDLLHPHISGNKWRKLKYNLSPGLERVYSLGGAYSNHLLALAYAAKAQGLASVGVISGAYGPLTPTLLQAKALGMQLVNVSRQHALALEQPAAQQDLMTVHGPGVWLPLGGANLAATRGCAEVVAEIQLPFNSLWCAVGSGATCAGLALGVAADQEVVGVPMVKDRRLAEHIQQLITLGGGCHGRWRLLSGYEARFARPSAALIHFIRQQEQRQRILLDGSYSAKLWQACFNEIASGRYDGQTLVLLHTGGLQSRYGLPDEYFKTEVLQ